MEINELAEYNSKMKKESTVIRGVKDMEIQKLQREVR